MIIYEDIPQLGRISMLENGVENTDMNQPPLVDWWYEEGP